MEAGALISVVTVWTWLSEVVSNTDSMEDGDGVGVGVGVSEVSDEVELELTEL